MEKKLRFGPNYLIPEKFQKKAEDIKKYEEFWLILPNFEIFMHKNSIKHFIINYSNYLIKIFK